MVRRARVEVEGGVYHVYNRVASGEGVFADPEEAERFVEVLRWVKGRDGWTVFAWCLMSNHYHLAVRRSAVPLWRGLHYLQGMVSRRFNRGRARTGGLWQSRYQAKLVEEERYLGELVLYIHSNPVRAGLVADPRQHEWSGHREILGRRTGALVDVDDALLGFGETERAALRGYRSAMRVACGRATDRAEPQREVVGLEWWSDRKLETRPGDRHVDLQGRSTGRERPSVTAEEFLKVVCRLLGAEEARLASRLRDRQTAELRRLIATLGVERWGQRGVGLAAALRKSPEVVSRWVGDGVRRRLADPAYGARLDDLDQRLAEETATSPERLPPTRDDGA
jgi:putative transposase